MYTNIQKVSYQHMTIPFCFITHICYIRHNNFVTFKKVTTRFSVPGRDETDLFPCQNFKTSSGTHIAPYSMEAGDLSLRIKRPECEAGFKNAWKNTSAPCIPLWSLQEPFFLQFSLYFVMPVIDHTVLSFVTIILTLA